MAMATSPAWLVWAVLLVGCRSSNGPQTQEEIGAPVPPSATQLASSASSVSSGAVSSAAASPKLLPPKPPPPKLPPALAGEPLQPLAVPGFGEAVVSVPLGARTPRPVVIALHG